MQWRLDPDQTRLRRACHVKGVPTIAALGTPFAHTFEIVSGGWDDGIHDGG